MESVYIKIEEETPFAIANYVLARIEGDLPKGGNLSGATNGKKPSGAGAPLFFVVVAENNVHAKEIAANLAFLLPPKRGDSSAGVACRVLLFPECDIEPFEQSCPKVDILLQRAACLTEVALIRSGQIDFAFDAVLVVTSVKSFVTKTAPVGFFREHLLRLQVGLAGADPVLLRDAMVEMGYIVSQDAREVGQVSLIGEALSFANAASTGIRLIFDEDSIERIIKYDLLSQETIEEMPYGLTVGPVFEVSATPDLILTFKSNFEGIGMDRESVNYQAIVEGIGNAPLFPYLPMFYNGLGTIIDHTAPSGVLFCNGQWNEVCRLINGLGVAEENARRLLGNGVVVPKEMSFVSSIKELDGLKGNAKFASLTTAD